MAFVPKTPRLIKLGSIFPDRITELEGLLQNPVYVYIDFANVIYWQSRLGWHIDLQRLKQFLDSFDTVKSVKFYNGELEGDLNSFNIIQRATKAGYVVKTKLVKILDLSINVSSIPRTSTSILEQFIRAPLIQKLKVENIEYLNSCLKDLNENGIMNLHDRKCNFDVEIGVDMLLDLYNNLAKTFVLMSGDSDFYDPVKQLLENGKKVILFCTVRKVSTELNSLRQKGLLIFDIQKIRNFICFGKEINVKGV